MRRLLLAGCALVVLGLPAGLLWNVVASPARWTYTSGQLVMDEQAAARQFGATGWFVVIGVVVGLVAGVLFDRLFHRSGWLVFVVVAVAAGLAAVVTAQLGLLVGPPNPTSVKHLSAGQTVPSRLRVDGLSPYVAWAAAASLGALASSWFRAGPQSPDGEDVGADAVVSGRSEPSTPS